jgi:hypothetical protein
MTKVLNDQTYQKLLCARPDHAAGARHRLPARRQGPEAHRLDAADFRQHGLPALQPPQRQRRRRAQVARDALVRRTAHHAARRLRPSRARTAHLHPRPIDPAPVHDRRTRPRTSRRTR